MVYSHYATYRSGPYRSGTPITIPTRRRPMTRKLSPTLAIFALALILPSLAFSGGKPRVPQSGDASGDAQATSGDTSKTDQNCAAWEQKGGTKAKQVCQDALNADIKYDAKE